MELFFEIKTIFVENTAGHEPRYDYTSIPANLPHGE